MNKLPEKTDTLEPFSKKLKRIMSQPTTEEIPQMPAAKFDSVMDNEMFGKRKKPKKSL